MTTVFKIAIFILLVLHGFNSKADKTLTIEDELQLIADLDIVWPLVQTVAIEYDLAITQLEFYKTDKEKEAFLCEFEDFVKEKYFKQILELKIRQGKLLLLLIHRELGKTPFDLLKEFRSIKRAIFWQRFARLVGANLKEEYSPEKYPLIEKHLVTLIASQPIK